MNAPSTTDDKIYEQRGLEEVLAKISFRPSCVDMGWTWQIRVFRTFWLIRAGFRRPDTNTGAIGTGFGRWEIIEVGATVSAIVKTCWVMVEMIVKHELMEAFCFDDKRVFDPHKTIEQLVANPRKETP